MQMTVAITNAEPVYAYQREAIEQAFQCPVRETYGMDGFAHMGDFIVTDPVAEGANKAVAA